MGHSPSEKHVHKKSRYTCYLFCTEHRNITHIAAVGSVETVYMRMDRLDLKAPQMFQHVHYSRFIRQIACMLGRVVEENQF
jgi:predicted secreted protein